MSRLCALGASLFACLLCSSWTVHAGAKPPKRDRPLLFGGPVTKLKMKLPLDPRLPTGADLPATEPRPPATASLCSLTRPVCVHALGSAQEARVAGVAAGARASLRTRRVCAQAAGAVARRRCGWNGRARLVRGGAARAIRRRRRCPLPGRIDQAPVFCRGPAAAGPLLERQAALCVGEALASTLDAGESPSARQAFALELWWISARRRRSTCKPSTTRGAIPKPRWRSIANPATLPRGASRYCSRCWRRRVVRVPGRAERKRIFGGGQSNAAGASAFDNEPTYSTCCGTASMKSCRATPT